MVGRGRGEEGCGPLRGPWELESGVEQEIEPRGWQAKDRGRGPAGHGAAPGCDPDSGGHHQTFNSPADHWPL